MHLKLTAAYQTYILANDASRTMQQDNAYLELPFTYFYDGIITVDIAAVRNSYCYTMTNFMNMPVGAMAGIGLQTEKISFFKL